MAMTAFEKNERDARLRRERRQLLAAQARALRPRVFGDVEGILKSMQETTYRRLVKGDRGHA